MPQSPPTALPSSHPSLEEFRRLCLAEFSFLTTELGFAVEPLPSDQLQNQFQVRFICSATRVIVEGRSFGSSIGVVLERLADGWCRLVDILALRSPTSAAP